MAHSNTCVCGQPTRAQCSKCGKFVRVIDGKFAVHEVAVCMHSHLEYKTCVKSDKPVGG